MSTIETDENGDYVCGECGDSHTDYETLCYSCRRELEDAPYDLYQEVQFMDREDD